MNLQNKKRAVFCLPERVAMVHNSYTYHVHSWFASYVHPQLSSLPASSVHTVNDISQAREKFCGFHRFLMNHESFPEECSVG